MLIKTLWSWELPPKLEGTVVICDVWAATTNITTLFKNGVQKLIIVNIDNVQNAKNEFKDSLTIGESFNLPKEFFKVSNLPIDVENAQVKGKTVLYMSNNGTRIVELVLEKEAKRVMTVSFRNMIAIGNYLKNLKEHIYLIASGDIILPDKKSTEDMVCAETLAKMIRGEKVDLCVARAKAEACIRTNYPGENYDNPNFKIVFSLGSSKSIPFCFKDKDELIRVEDLNV